jgi:hypothetical protein
MKTRVSLVMMKKRKKRGVMNLLTRKRSRSLLSQMKKNPWASLKLNDSPQPPYLIE